MEKIKFEFPAEMTDRLDQLNSMMQFIINRAAGFNRENFDCIIIPENHMTNKSFLLYRAVAIIAMTKRLPIYTNKKFSDVPWLEEKNENLHKVSRFKLDRIEKKQKPLIFSTSLYGEMWTREDGPRIFDGFDKEDINELVKVLYDYDTGEF